MPNRMVAFIDGAIKIGIVVGYFLFLAVLGAIVLMTAIR